VIFENARKLITAMVKINGNGNVKYLGQRSFSLKAIVETHIVLTALRGPLK